MSLWGSISGQQIPNLLEVRLGIIGKGASGKTCLLNGIRHVVRDTNLASGLEFSPRNPDEAVKIARDRKLIDSTTAEKALGSTRENHSFIYSIRQGHKNLLNFTYHDAIGQLLEMSGEELGKENQSLRKQFITNIKESDVIWVVISLNKGSQGIFLDRDDVDIAKSYVVDVLEKRDDNCPLSLAIVLSKSDLAGAEGSDEAKQMVRRVLDLLAGQFRNLVEHSKRVHASAVFPTSAFGWDNADDIEGGFSRTTKGRMEPYNIDKLLLWSLIHGLEQPKKRRNQDGLDFQIARNLSQALGRSVSSDSVLVLKQMV